MITAVVLGLGVAALAFGVLSRDDGKTNGTIDSSDRILGTNDIIERACDVEKQILLRIWRGFDPDRSEDIVMVPQYPNFSGTFDLVNHSGPWTYLTNVPLVLYGPGHIAASGRVKTASSITDVYATAGALTGVDLPRRSSRVLREALNPAAEGPPKLILTLVWDGVGRNVLNQWPDAWPTLARLERRGSSYLNASVGSSQTITPATHTSLGTGAYPRSHGITGIYYRKPNGKVGEAFSQQSTRDLRLTTWADEIDQAYDNQSLVGLLGSRSWHMGMLGHGATIEGGDKDQLGILRDELIVAPSSDDIKNQTSGYDTPGPLLDISSWSRLQEYGDRVDRSDGAADGEWLGHPVLDGKERSNPAWVMHETDAVLEILEAEGYGADDIPDMFFTNFKMADKVGHNYLMDSQEMDGVLRALDESLKRIVRYLNREVEDYVVILTADHGHTPRATTTGAWPVRTGVLLEDIQAHFDAENESLIRRSVAVGLFLNHQAMRVVGVDDEDVARYLNAYTIRDNWPEDALPEGYEDRGGENVFAAAWPTSEMDEVMRCAFGSKRPTKNLNG